MASSSRRKNSPLFDVFQDADDTTDDFELLRTLQSYTENMGHPAMDEVIDTNLILNPPASQSSVSPSKRRSPHSSPHIDVDSFVFDSVAFPQPHESFPSDSPTKKPSYAPYYPAIAPKPQKALFSMFPSSKSNKENQISSDASSDPLFAPSSVLGKRLQPEATFVRDKSVSKKRAVEEEFNGPIPEPEDLPVVIDEGGKPPFSYAQLIGMAILRAPGRKMTLAQIYKWINDTFEFYHTAGSGWQNSIRHNLSLNKAFVKTERPKDDPGKGHYWTIAEGFALQFVRDKPQRRPVLQEQQAYPSYVDHPASDTYQLPPPISASSFALPTKPPRAAVDSSKFPGDHELSSDGTVAASDEVDSGQQEEEAMPPPAARHLRATLSPEPELHSSPPVPRHQHTGGTPIPDDHFISQSRSGGRKKRFDSFKDSGFYSSIESSVGRPQHIGPLCLTSDADHRSSVMKRGRAEEEIARMRSSSFDHSPSKTKRPRFSKPAPSSALNSSSPLRPTILGFPPLTPGITMKKPLARAPPTISPGTHLARHRESVRDLVGTPAQGLLKSNQKKWSPFSFTEDPPFNCSPLKSIENATMTDDEDEPRSSPLKPTLMDIPTLTFDNPFDDAGDEESVKWSAFFASGSPVARKPSAARPNILRAHTSSGILGDITNGSRRSRLASPFRMTAAASKADSSRSVSPTKRSTLDSSLKADAFLGFGSSSDTENEGLPSHHGNTGMDLLKGFRSIGSPADKENAPAPSQQANKLPADKSKSSRPPLGRAATNVI